MITQNHSYFTDDMPQVEYYANTKVLKTEIDDDVNFGAPELPSDEI